jgi:hypothetical protein
LIVAVPESGAWEWAMVKREQVTLMFQTLSSIQRDLPELNITAKGSPGTFFIEVTNIELLHQAVQDKLEVVSSMRNTFYGKKEFTIKDINGYFLTFAENN